MDSDIYNQDRNTISKHPMVFTQNRTEFDGIEDSYRFRNTNFNGQQGFEKGLYNDAFPELYAISLAAAFLESGRIFLLGFNAGSVAENQFRQSAYNEMYKPFEAIDEDVEVFNVGEDSNIEQFEKISYDKFFKMLDKKEYELPQIQKHIKQRISE